MNNLQFIIKVNSYFYRHLHTDAHPHAQLHTPPTQFNKTLSRWTFSIDATLRTFILGTLGYINTQAYCRAHKHRHQTSQPTQPAPPSHGPWEYGSRSARGGPFRSYHSTWMCVGREGGGVWRSRSQYLKSGVAPYMNGCGAPPSRWHNNRWRGPGCVLIYVYSSLNCR
jgi:hypothetical protein